MKRITVLVLVCLLIVAAAGLFFPLQDSSLAQVLRQATAQELYFPETGHMVTGDILRAYQSVPNPELVFGFPITEAFQDSDEERLIQYFERARFELYVENPPELRVKISDLGYLSYKAGPELPIPGNLQACRYFEETRKPVCFAFLDFFDANGGVPIFGYPITSFELHDGRITQYFQRARFEWHPELPVGSRVQLTDLGRVYFEIIGEEPYRYLALPLTTGSNLARRIVSMQVHAYPKIAIAPVSGDQTISIVVQDQNLMPIAGATVYLEVIDTGGVASNTVIPYSTNDQGVVTHTFAYQNQRPGVVIMRVHALFEGLQGRTVTSFRIW